MAHPSKVTKTFYPDGFDKDKMSKWGGKDVNRNIDKDTMNRNMDKDTMNRNMDKFTNRDTVDRGGRNINNKNNNSNGSSNNKDNNKINVNNCPIHNNGDKSDRRTPIHNSDKKSDKIELKRSSKKKGSKKHKSSSTSSSRHKVSFLNHLQDHPFYQQFFQNQPHNAVAGQSQIGLTGQSHNALAGQSQIGLTGQLNNSSAPQTTVIPPHVNTLTGLNSVPLATQSTTNVGHTLIEEKKTPIISVQEFEGGIRIFIDGKEYTIYHGRDGKDGKDGGDGADGRDGKDGITHSLPKPIIHSLSTDRGKKSETITIFGENFDLNSQVVWGNLVIKGDLLDIKNNHITFEVPAYYCMNNDRDISVSVSNRYEDTSNSLQFSYI